MGNDQKHCGDSDDNGQCLHNHVRNRRSLPTPSHRLGFGHRSRVVLGEMMGTEGGEVCIREPCSCLHANSFARMRAGRR